MLDTLKQVAPFIGSKKLSQYLVIRNHTVTAFNGTDVFTLPIACDINFAPKGKAFIRAVKKCKDGLALWVNEEGNVLVHAGDVTETIECAPMEKFPEQIQKGFWFNEPRAKKPPKPKNIPPEPVWLREDYLPGLEEARAFNVPMFDSDGLVAAIMASEPMICDCEVFKNYVLVAFTSVKTGKVYFFEKKLTNNCAESRDSIDGYGATTERIDWVLKHALIVTFNGNNYDVPILSLMLAGVDVARLKQASDRLISGEIKPWQVLKSFKVRLLKLNHIDLVEVCPGVMDSLKIYAGRLHAPRMQSLPFHFDALLSKDQIAIIRYYCVNDLTGTAFCLVGLREQIEIRQKMSERYGIDLRSKSDAQIAEAVFNSEIQRLTFAEPSRPMIAPGTRYYYRVPKFVRFETPMMNALLNKVKSWEFWLDEGGSIRLPIDPTTQKQVVTEIKIANAVYTMGIGGLHSTETTVCHKADSNTVIFDRDVTSYYPSIILNLELYPQHLGTAFLQVYRSIVQRRIEAKKAKNKVEAEMLKIVVNGTFGKLGSKWSTLYAPDLLMQVTITGQLALLMLIERLELRGITVCSGNTDGIVCKCPVGLRSAAQAIFQQWETETGFATEETEYTAVYSRDVNNYIAVKPDGKTKTKGVYFNPWAYPEYQYDRFKKNPDCTIVLEAVTNYLTKGIPISQTILNEKDPRKFVAIRTVRGGGSKDGVYLGKAVRWYYARGETGCIVANESGNKVATTDGARPCMDLPKMLPEDIDFDLYTAKAAQILVDIGAIKPPI